MDDAVTRRTAAALNAVRAQTSFFHEHFGRAESEWKPDGSRVTHADYGISRALSSTLLASFPEDQFFSEETEPGTKPVPLTARFSWIVDPIDGTNNYALGVPVCAISLALLRNGVPVCGFVYDGGLRVLFHGGPGIGLFADGVPVSRVSHTHRHERVLAVHTPISERHHALVCRLIAGYKLRAFGSGALHLTYAALGRVDAALDLTVRVWDIAAAWAFCGVTGVGVRFLDRPVFPLKEFNVHMKAVRYLAGPRDLVEQLERIVREIGAPPGNG